MRIAEITLGGKISRFLDRISGVEPPPRPEPGQAYLHEADFRMTVELDKLQQSLASDKLKQAITNNTSNINRKTQINVLIKHNYGEEKPWSIITNIKTDNGDNETIESLSELEFIKLIEKHPPEDQAVKFKKFLDENTSLHRGIIFLNPRVIILHYHTKI